MDERMDGDDSIMHRHTIFKNYEIKIFIIIIIINGKKKL